MKEKINLSEAEWKIMLKLWSLEPITIMQLTASLKEETGWSKNTVITLLKRMEAKNAVAYVQGNRAKEYYAVLKREDAQIVETRSFLRRIFNGSVGLMLNSMIEQNEISQDDLQEIQKILDRAEHENND